MASNNKKLRIAAFDTTWAPFPLPGDFPRPLAPLIIALDIAEGLAKKGHDVSFFGPKGSYSNNFRAVALDFEPLYKNPIWEMANLRGTEREKIATIFDQYVLSKIFQEHQKIPFDIIHIHPVDRVLPFAPLFSDTPIVSTLHDPIYDWRGEIFKMLSATNMHLISISDAQRKPAPSLNYAATVYNGIRIDQFSFSDKIGDYLFFAGRLQENKGVYEAIQVAKMTNSKLLIAGSPNEGKYWEEKIKPNLNDDIQYLGLVPYEKLADYYKNAKAVLFPILWEEPFGLVMTESMACGTPVVAFRRGSVPEVIIDGKTGFIVDNVAEMVKAVKKIDTINRQDCRDHVEKNFSIKNMVDGYEKLFLKLAKGKSNS
ncbi:MAG: glycosyltransferase family 4 protein [bacterium]|nr:glycosyltransferase family 4 protein [bacterium]